jgi:heme exporter protein CcmD
VLHWFDPGKYAAFVAGAYGVSAIVLGAMVLESLWRARYWRKAAERVRPTRSQSTAKINAGAP